MYSPEENETVFDLEETIEKSKYHTTVPIHFLKRNVQMEKMRDLIQQESGIQFVFNNSHEIFELKQIKK